jgi:PemK-like, MazF-like toxin of type II toxin-antitoxin system
MPIPNPGLVMPYAYLWHHEHRAGREEGQKNRPSVIVLTSAREADGTTLVTVFPITHSPPTDPNSAVEIPLPVKRHLGLDDDRSWIVVDVVRYSRPSPIGIESAGSGSHRADDLKEPD